MNIKNFFNFFEKSQTKNPINQTKVNNLNDQQIQELLNDRVKFKLYAAETHLNNLKNIKQTFGNIMGKGKISAEIEIDNFFAQIIGAKDSLLIQISEKLNLKIPISKVNSSSVNAELKSISKQNLLSELNKLASDPTSWFWKLNELRNHSIHRKMLNKHIKVGLYDNINTGENSNSSPEEYFLADPTDPNPTPMDKQIIEYLEESLENMQNLIESIRSKDPLLN